MSRSFLRSSSFRFLILSFAVFGAGLEPFPSPAQAQNAESSSSWGCEQTKTLQDYQDELKANPRSSLANYCKGDLLMEQRRYQASVNAYRSSLAGDGDAKWTKVWSHIQIGKIFDITNQRERAELEYKLALQTDDNTGNAMEVARNLLEHPFEQSTNR